MFPPLYFVKEKHIQMEENRKCFSCNHSKDLLWDNLFFICKALKFISIYRTQGKCFGCYSVMIHFFSFKTLN